MPSAAPNLTETAETGPAERRLSLGHRLMMLNHVMSKLAMNRRHLDRSRTQLMDETLGVQAAQTLSDEGENNMLVLGDLTINDRPMNGSAAAPNRQQPTEAVRKPTPLWQKAATVAGLLGSGIAGGAGLTYTLQSDPQNDLAPAIEQAADYTDTSISPSVIIRRPIEIEKNIPIQEEEP